MMNLKCVSLNIRGINKAIKRRKLFRWLHNGKYDVIFLQETYNDKTIENVWRAEWEGDIFYSHGSKHSRGVMTLLRPTVKVENINTTCDRNRRVLIVNFTKQDEEFCLANIYAPNDQNLQADFYTQKLRPYVNSNLILGGDFNCPLLNIDKKGGKDISSRKNAIQSIVEMSNNLNLVDIWRLQHLSLERFTWQNSSGKIRCRLDYWLISKHLIPRTSKTVVKSYYDSDHSPIYAEIQYKNNNKSSGPGFWKFNNSLLDNEEFVIHSKFFLTHAKEKHRDTNDKRLYWEMIKMEIRDFCIRFSKRFAKTKKKRETDLLCKLKQLNERLDQNHQDTNLVVKVERVRLELQKISEHKTKGAIIRSRVRWYECDERNSKYFVNLEKRAYDRKHIVRLKTKENIHLEEPNKILCQMENFYKTLYSSQISEDTFNDSAPLFLNCNNIKRLDGEQQKTCEGLITEDEFLSALKQFSKNKTPGSDGLTAEFYFVFLGLCFNSFKRLFKRRLPAWRNVDLTRKGGGGGVISLLPKKNKDTLLLKNWRPITLLNIDYKIATKCIAKRLEKVLPMLIDRDQTGYVKNSFIGENIRLISDVIESYEGKNLPGMLLFIDFEKAFDSLE